MATPFRRRVLSAAALTAAGALLITGCAESQRDDAGGSASGGDTAAVDGNFIFAASSDPKTLDPAFASDGESFRVSRQIFEGLVGTKPGTADPAPLLAEPWESSEDGLTHTFQLKKDVKFHDGTPFDAEAVCANFDRWYNFEGIQQAETVSYYYGKLFRGFADKPEDAASPTDVPAIVRFHQIGSDGGLLAAPGGARRSARRSSACWAATCS